MWIEPDLTLRAWASRTTKRRDCQSRRTPSRSKTDSFDMRTRLRASAWAMSILSKGPRWGPGKLPSRCLVAISHAVVALIGYSLDGLKMARCTASRRWLLSVGHQIRAGVSSSRRNRNHLPMLSTLPPAAGRRNCLEGQIFP